LKQSEVDSIFFYDDDNHDDGTLDDLINRAIANFDKSNPYFVKEYARLSHERFLFVARKMDWWLTEVLYVEPPEDIMEIIGSEGQRGSNKKL